MQTDIEITPSPNGAFAVHAEPWEARASQWVYCPRIVDLLQKELLWSPADKMWSLDKATWTSDSIVRLRLSKFPGDQHPPCLEVIMDCETRTARVGDSAELCVTELEPRLDAALAGRPRA